MTRTFLVKVNIPIGSGTPIDLSNDVADALDKAGIAVISVHPWKEHGMPAVPPLIPPPLQ